MDSRTPSACSQNEDQDENLDIRQQQAMANAIQKHSVALFTDLPVSLDELLDFLIENDCLSLDEATAFTDKPNDCLNDRVVRLILTITKRSFDTMNNFLLCVKKFHHYIVENIYQTYENCMEIMEIEIKCDYCFLQTSADLSKICQQLWADDKIEKTLLCDVTNLKSSLTDKQLWKMFADECNSYDSRRRKSIIVQIRRYLENRGHYCELVRRLWRLNSFHCECDSVYKDREQEALEKMNQAKCLPPRRVSEHRAESTYTSSEVDGGIRQDPLTSSDCQGQKLHSVECEERKKVCLRKAIDLNKLALIDCMEIVLRSVNFNVEN